MSKYSEYYKNNRSRILERVKNYSSQEETKERIKEYRKKYYHDNKEKAIRDNAEREKSRIAFERKVATKYGCQNLKCGWDGDFLTSQLHFHHIDPKSKEYAISSMRCNSYETIIEEMNKCCVLCKNCHFMIHNGVISIDDCERCEVTMNDVEDIESK